MFALTGNTSEVFHLTVVSRLISAPMMCICSIRDPCCPAHNLLSC